MLSMIETVINYLFAPFTITTGHSTKNIQTKNKKDYNAEHSTIDFDFATNKTLACAKPKHTIRKRKLPYDRLSELQSEEHHTGVYKLEDYKNLPSGDESSDYILRIVFGKLLYRRPHCKGR